METDKIKCPLCGYIYEDSWELNDSDDEDVQCESCGENFHLIVIRSVTYETRKCYCKSGEHEYKEALFNDVTQKTIDKWNKEKFMGINTHVPHKQWFRRCSKCGYWDHSDKKTAPGSECPWSGMIFREVTLFDYN